EPFDLPVEIGRDLELAQVICDSRAVREHPAYLDRVLTAQRNERGVEQRRGQALGAGLYLDDREQRNRIQATPRLAPFKRSKPRQLGFTDSGGGDASGFVEQPIRVRAMSFRGTLGKGAGDDPIAVALAERTAVSCQILAVCRGRRSHACELRVLA